MKSCLGVGCNLHLPWLDFFIESKPPLPYLEVIADNWLSPGPHHGKLLQIRADYPVLFHCVGMNLGGIDDLDDNYLNAIGKLKEIYQPLHISDHLCFQKIKTHHFHDLLPLPFNESSLNRCVDRIDKVQTHFGEPILVENLSYYVEFSNSTLTESEFLNHLAVRSGNKFLLDLNNIWVNHQNLGINTDQFIQEIDLDRVGEIHLAGPDLKDGFYVDTHGSEVVDEVKHIFSVLAPLLPANTPVIYERDNDLPPVEKMVENCQDLEKLLWNQSIN